MARTFSSGGRLTLDFIRACRKRLRELKVVDTMGGKLTGADVLMRSVVLRRLLRRHVLAPDERHVGVLLPPSSGAVLANMALALDRRVSANLNYTVSSAVMNACIEQAGIRHVLTSKRVVSKLNLDIKAELVCLEDFKDKPTTWDKAAAAMAVAMPAKLLHRSLGLHKVRPEDELTVIFTSGSTGIPKGVVLTYENVASNVWAIDQVVHLRPEDTLVGVLPFFHSFGYTITLWTVMSMDIRGAYHFDPLGARQVGQLVREHQGTLLLATPTFLRSYLKRCEPVDFASLNVVVAGAEKLPRELTEAFDQKFHVRPVEGYGTTELSPLVSVNIPPSRAVEPGGLREGSVGRPVPEVSAKIVSLDDGRTLGANEPGMLMITGPNVMKGYLGRDDLTREVVRDGWYVTGDVATIDDEGFIHITGRESRFSKIGGEMVPHILVEERIAQILGAKEEDGLKAVVTAVPDPRKGERIAVVHTKLDVAVDELLKKLSESGLPNIYLPARDCFFEIDKIPVLGTGKLDLKGLKEVALQRSKQRQEERGASDPS